MTKEEFLKIKKRLDDKARKVREAKEEEYFSTDDVLANLKKIAQFRNKKTPQMIMDLVSKQLVSVSDMVDNYEFEEFSQEEWDAKFVDILNYTYKLYASIVK